VLLKRGIDQCLAQHGDFRLYEPAVRDARQYVAQASMSLDTTPIRLRRTIDRRA
jgi:hypothetical protein